MYRNQNKNYFRIDGKNSETETAHNLVHDFDVLIFTQHWPVTVCYEWKEKNENHQCLLPSPKEIWTIHGIWPTKFHTIGPSFCNNSAKFDIGQIEPIQNQLEVYWLNIESGTPLQALWKHEWQKHGTCAAQLTALDNENKYFGQGLKWLEQFSMSALLSKSNIVPGNSYPLEHIANELRNLLKFSPVIECRTEKETGRSLLFEIRLCFTKDLKLTNCDGVQSMLGQNQGWRKTAYNTITNCNSKKEVDYLNVVPIQLKTTEIVSIWNIPMVQLYKLLKILQWATL